MRPEPLKDPVRHSEAQVRGEIKPHDHIGDAEAQTRHSVEDWEKRKTAGSLHEHEQAPAAPAPEIPPKPEAPVEQNIAEFPEAPAPVSKLRFPFKEKSDA